MYERMSCAKGRKTMKKKNRKQKKEKNKNEKNNVLKIDSHILCYK